MMSTAYELMEHLRTEGASRFEATGLAHDHSAVVRTVRRQRAVRGSLVAVTSVAAVGGIAFGVTHLNTTTPITPLSPATPEPLASAPTITEQDVVATVSVAKHERIENIAADLVAAVGSPGDDGMAALTNALPPEANGDPEGWVLAGEYGFEAGTDLQSAAAQMTGQMVEELEGLGVPRDQWLPTVIMASIVEQEAPAGPADQAGVARVLLNRLDADMMLQVESPLAYFVHADTQLVTDDGWAVDTPYNTYMYKGLPPGAIGSFTHEALTSTVHPNDGDWLYFLRGPDGRVSVFSTFEEFTASVNEQFPGTGAGD